MSLRTVAYSHDYRSGYDDIVNDFFRPSLRQATRYWRAVGYFSSSALEAFGSPLGEFVANGGHIRLVTSVELSERDIAAIKNGSSPQDVCAQRLQQIIETDFADGVGTGTLRLARLLEIGRLDIQIAIPKSGRGIYHEKIGVFLDGKDFVAFTGSSNESRNAFESNRECVDVYTSWNSRSRAERKRSHFEALWNDVDRGVEVFTFPEAARKSLIRVCRKRGAINPPPSIVKKKWRHQDEALEKFLDAERGILNMATGTGKTRTAVNILRRLFERDDIDSVIVCTNGNDLLNQWHKELLPATRTVDKPLRLYRHYFKYKQLQDFALDPKDAVLLVSRNPLAYALRRLSKRQCRRTLLIHDEVHGLGSPANRERLEGLSDHVRFRLGLSATPERIYDAEGNEFIERHVGPVLMTFGLDKAIRRGILAPFRYFPIPFRLTESDRDRIAGVYRKKAAREAAGDPMSETEIWIDLARVYKTSEAKLPAFSEFIAVRNELLERCIIFVETMEYGESVLDIVHRHHPHFHTYYSGEDARTLDEFARAELECLITCHRLSEGIDIKSLHSVILFASERARLETTQRIGRCLRTDPATPDKIANIVDFIRETTDPDAPNPDLERREWLSLLATIRPSE